MRTFSKTLICLDFSSSQISFLGDLDECTSVPNFDYYRGKGLDEKTNEENGPEVVRNEDITQCRTMPIFPYNNEKEVHWYTQSSNLDQQSCHGESRSVVSVVSDVSHRAGSNLALRPRIYKLYEKGDQYGCEDCQAKGDKWYIQEHPCKCLQGRR